MIRRTQLVIVFGIFIAVFVPSAECGVAWLRTVGEQTLTLEPTTTDEGELRLQDRETKTTWHPLTGEALDGPLKGKLLAPLVAVPIRLTRYRAFYPDGAIYGPEPTRPRERGNQSNASSFEGKKEDAPIARHPEWKYVAEGTAVKLQGRTWNTRRIGAVEDTKDYAVVGQRNGTATLLGDDFVNHGKVEWEAYYEPGALEVGGGGKHFHEVMSYVGDRAGKFRETIRSGSSSRIEIASLADGPRCIVWNYGPEFKGQAFAIIKLGPPPKEEQWVKWSLQWDYEPETGELAFQVTQDAEAYSGTAQLNKNSEGPGRFFLHGHVETNAGKGSIRFRNFVVAGSDAR